MHAVSVNEYLNDPLAGCEPIFRDPGAYLTFRDSLKVRLAVLYTRSQADMIVGALEMESELQLMHPNEYSINEMLYELRYGGPGHSQDYEKTVLDTWTRALLKKFDADLVLDFVIQVKLAREVRFRG